MAKYRKKPVEIEAFQLTHNPALWASVQPQWFKEAIEHGNAWYQGGDQPYYTISTLEGDMRANPSDWIVRGVKGELYPCKADIFAATYEPVEE